MYITSSAFTHNNPIPSRYTCDGENVSVPIAFHEVPPATKSFVLIVDDPDSPSGTWDHWVLWNIPSTTTNLPENAYPTGAVAGVTSFGTPGYGGPCPHGGTHRYFFKLYALDTMLDLDANHGKSEVEQAMTGHVLANAELIGLYTRQT